MEAIQNFVDSFQAMDDKLYRISSGAVVPADIELDMNGELSSTAAEEAFISDRCERMSSSLSQLKG